MARRTRISPVGKRTKEYTDFVTDYRRDSDYGNRKSLTDHRGYRSGILERVSDAAKENGISEANLLRLAKGTYNMLNQQTRNFNAPNADKRNRRMGRLGREDKRENWETALHTVGLAGYSPHARVGKDGVIRQSHGLSNG